MYSIGKFGTPCILLYPYKLHYLSSESNPPSESHCHWILLCITLYTHLFFSLLFFEKNPTMWAWYMATTTTREREFPPKSQ